MGLLDQFKGPIVQEVMNMVKNHEGGLAGLVGKLTQSGLGEQVASWVGMGENKPVEANKLQQALGDNTVKDIAKKLNIPVEEVSESLAGALPQVVDKLTPNGKIEEDSFIEKGLSALKGLFKF
jgi:uncharacterized protein YidB (DUF937 family)